jgi:hypothetical protein
MTIQILTPTGAAMIRNTHTKAGYKALWQYIKHTQKERTPFIVLPAGTLAHDLHTITSIDNCDI